MYIQLQIVQEIHRLHHQNYNKREPKGYVDKEDVYALAQKVVDQITNDSMTDMEKAFAIYRWTKQT